MAKKTTDAAPHTLLSGIALETYAARRAHVLKTLKDSVALVFAGDMDASIHGDFRAHPHFQRLFPNRDAVAIQEAVFRVDTNDLVREVP
jgi:hypothetical protein